MGKWMFAISASHNKNKPLKSLQRLTIIIINNVITNILAEIWFFG